MTAVMEQNILQILPTHKLRWQLNQRSSRRRPIRMTDDANVRQSNMSGHSVTQLLCDYRDGNEEALAALFERYVDSVRGVARRRLDKRTSQVTAGSDIANDVFLLLSQKMKGEQAIELKDRDHLWNFLCALVRGRVSDERKRAKALKRGGDQFQQLGSGDDDEGLETLAMVADSPELIALALDQAEAVRIRLEDLEARVLSLKLQLRTNAEMCQLLGIPQHKLSRILRRIRDEFLKQFPDE